MNNSPLIFPVSIFLAALLLVGCATGTTGVSFGLLSTPRPDATTPPLSDIPAGINSEDGLLPPPTPTPYPNSELISIGASVEGRDLLAWQFGQGPVTLVLVGGTHGGYELNSVTLVSQLVQTVQRNSDTLLPGIRLVMMPSLNPDGVAQGTGPEGRFNANSVDLNRNWGCGWEPVAYWGEQAISPGTFAFSEPETLALRAYLLALEPDAVVFYHSAVGAIFPGTCGENGSNSVWLGELLSEATGYPLEDTFAYYEVSGTADDWLDERGIPAVTVELTDRTDPELERNLAGLMALQCRFALDGSAGAEALVSPRVQAQCLESGVAPGN